MKKLLLLSFVSILSIGALVAQNVNVTSSGGTSTSATYPTLAAAITAINGGVIHTGTITAEVVNGYTETAPVGGFSITATGTLANPIVFKKALPGGANPVLNAYVGTATPTSAAPDGIMSIRGGDYITIDGLTFTDGNTTNPATMEYGVGLFKASAGNGANNNTIQNCIFNMQRVNAVSGSAPMVEGAVGILVINSTATAATTALTPTNGGTLATNGTNSANKFYANAINGGNYGIVFSGFSATVGVGPTPTATTFLGDLGNDVGGNALSTGNTILNYGGGGSAIAAAAIRANFQWSVNISYNTTNNNNGSGVNNNSTLRGIYAQAGTSANATITNNTVTIKGGGTTSTISAIDNGIGSTAASNTVNINNNTITGCDYSTATSGVFNGIINSSTATNVNINSNVITNSTFPGTGTHVMIETGSPATATANSNSISNISRSGASGSWRGIKTTSPTNFIANSNTIEGLSWTLSTSTGSIDAIYSLSSAVNVTANNNIIRNLSTPLTGTITGINEFGSSGLKTFQGNQIYSFFTTAGGAGGASFRGISESTGTTNDISGNLIYSLNSTGSTGGTAGTIVGITISSGTTNNIYKNKIYDLSSTSSNPTVSGLTLSGGTTHNVYNNIIGDIRASAANAANPLIGINITGGTTANLYYNTVSLNASSSGALFGSSGISFGTTTNVNLRNSVIVNTSSSNGAANTAALRRSSGTASTIPANYATTSNNNLFFAGTPGANNLIYVEGASTFTNPIQTIASLKTFMSSRDLSSVTENPTFVSTTGSNANFLHINTTVPTQIESGAVTISGFTDDFDGDIRNVSTPDIGADEFTGVLADFTPPAITFTPIAFTCNTAGITLNASISDPSGVPTSGAGLPVLYWNVNAGAYTAATGTYVSGTTYSFTFGAGVSAGDMLSYYIVAQDNAPAQNIAVNPSVGAGGLTANPPAAGTPPTTPNSFTIQTTLSGTYQVGASQAPPFNTLTAAINRYNTSCISGAVIFELTDASYSAAETFPISVLANSFASASNTLTIRPATGVTAVVTGAPSTSAGIINLNGANYVTLDGRAGGTGTTNALTFENTSLAIAAGFTIQFINEASNNTIKYCDVKGASTAVTTSGNIIFGTTTGVNGNDNNTIDFCNIYDASTGFPTNCIYALGTTTTAAQANDNITVSNCNIYNFFNAANGVRGMSVGVGNSGWTITGNSFYQTASRSITSGTSNAMNCLFITNTSNAAAFTVTNNYFGGSAPLAAGSPMTFSSTTTSVYSLLVVSTSNAATANSIQGNVFENISLGTTSTGTTSNVIRTQAGNHNIGNVTPNVFGSTATTGSITYAPATSGTYTVADLGGTAAGTVNFQNNIIAGISVNTGTSAGLRGINVSSSTSGVYNITGNTIGSTTVPNSISCTTATGSITGILMSGSVAGTQNVSNNTLANISAVGNVSAISSSYSVAGAIVNINSNNIRTISTSGGATMNGIINTGSTVTMNIFKNAICDLSGAVATSTVNGISSSTGTSVNVFNNRISDLRTPIASATNPLIGISITGGTAASLSYNSVYLNATSSGANFGSSAVSVSSTPTVSMNNNIFVNTSTANGTGVSVAHRRSTATLGTYAAGSDRNDYFASTIYFDGTNTDATLAAYKSRMGTLDQNAVSENAPFLSTVCGNTDFMKMNTATMTLMESGGAPVAGITDDFEGNTRNASTPDIGADEFAGIPFPQCAGMPASATIQGTDVCPNGSTSLSLSNTYTELGYTYQWASATTPGGPYTNMGTGVTQATGSLTVPTYYVCTITCSISGQSFATVEKSILINVLPTISVTPASGLICNPGGTAVALTASNGVSYTWSPATGLSATTGASVNANPAATTTYTVTGTDANGCTNTATAVVTITLTPQNITATATPSNICVGGSSTLTASATIPVPANVGTATTTIGGANGNPYRSGNGAGNQIKTQLLYTAAELTAAGLVAGPISELGFTTTTSTGTVINFEIRIGSSAATVLTTTFETSPTTLVFTQATFTPVAGINMHTFNAGAFTWDGTSNILVQTCQTNSITGTSNVSVYAPGFASNVSAQTSTTACSNLTGTAVTNKPIIRFTQSLPLPLTWQPGGLIGSPQVVTPASTTTYTVTANNAGCTASASATVSAGVPLLASATANQTTICNGQSTTLNASVSGGGTPYTYLWAGSDGSTPAATANPSVTPTSTTTYSVTVSDNCGSTAIGSVMITVNPVPSATAGVLNSAPICSGQTLSLTGSTDIGTTFAWTGPNGFASADQNPTINSITTLASGVYALTVSLNGCSSAASSVMVSVNSTPTGVVATASQNTIIAGASVDLSSTSTTPAATILNQNFESGIGTWTTTNTTTGGTLPTSAAWTIQTNPFTYSAIVYNSNNGTNGGTKFIWSNSDIVGSGAVTNTTLVSPAFSTLGFSAATLNFRMYYKNLTSGTAEVFVETSTDGTSWATSQSYSANQGTATGFAALSVPMTANQAVNYIRFRYTTGWGWYVGIDDISVSGTPTYSYAWSSLPVSSVPAVQNPTGIVPSGNTTYTVVVTSSSGCSATASTSVTVNPRPTSIVSGGGSVCFGDTRPDITFDLTGTAPFNFTYTDGTTPTTIVGHASNTFTINAATAGTYSVTALSDANGAAISGDMTGSATVEVKSRPITNAGVDVTINCTSPSATLVASGGASYLWSTGETTETISVTPASITIYSVTATAANGCTDTDGDGVEVDVDKTAPTTNAGVDQFVNCTTPSAALTASGGVSYLWSTGETTTTIDVSPSVTTGYTVTATAANGCTDTDGDGVEVEADKVAPSTNAGADVTVNCTNPSATLSASGGQSYLWSTGETTASITVSPTIKTPYSVTATAANGCTDTDGDEVETDVDQAKPLTNAGADVTTNCTNPEATLTASGGTNYLWSNGATTERITVNPATVTMYSVTATAANGCTDTDGDEVEVDVDKAAPTTNAGADVTTNCTTPEATLTASGGTSYLWSTGETTASISANPAALTTYTVTATAANGCTDTDGDGVEVDVDKVAPSTNAGADVTVSCSNPTATLTATGGTSYLWSTGANTASIDVSPTGLTTYSVTATAANGCTDTDGDGVEVEADKVAPSTNAGADVTVTCSSPSATLSASGGQSYLWSTGETTASITASPTTKTPYSVTATASNGCTDTDGDDVETDVDQAKPSTNAGADVTTNCTNPEATLTASGGMSYLWSNGATTARITVNPATQTTYTVTATAANGCTDDDGDGVEVDVDKAAPTTNAGADQFVNCTTPSAALTASGGVSYLWSTGETTATIDVSPSVTTVYTVIATAANGCTDTDGDGVEVEADKVAPTTNAGADVTVTCSNPSATLSASGGQSYLWSTGETTASITVSPTIKTPYSVTATASNGCTDTDGDDVETDVDQARPLTNAGADVTTNCTNPEATLTASGGTSYLWSNGATTASITVNPATRTTYSVTATAANGCTDDDGDGVEVEVDKLAPATNAGADQAVNCTSPSTTLTASGGVSYMWSTGETGATITVTPASTLTYTVTATAANGCTDSDGDGVEVEADKTAPTTNAGADASVNCTTPAATLHATGGVSYLWSTGATTASIDVSPTTTRSYTVTATAANGCTDTDGDGVEVVADKIAPVTNAGADVVVDCATPLRTLTATGGATYLWSTGATTVSIIIGSGTTDTYSVTATAANGCVDADGDEVSVTVDKAPPAANAGQDVTINCTTPGAVLTATGGVSYSWNNGASQGVVQSPASTTIYTVIVTGANGCTASDDMVLTVDKNAPIANAGADATIDCTVSTANLVASGGISYRWSTGETTANISVTPQATTIYTVTVTGMNGCTATDEVMVTIDRGSFIITASDDVTLDCASSSTMLTAAGGLTYLWSNGATDASITVSPAATTLYTVTISGTGCQGLEEVLVTVNRVPIITCPADKSVNTDLNSCFASNVDPGTPINVHAVCNNTTTMITEAGNMVSAATEFSVGAHVLVYKVTEISGNTATCSMTLTVSDVQKPVISGAPSDATLSCQDAGIIPNQAAALASVSVSDNCSATVACVQVSTKGSNPNACSFYTYTVTNTWTATDIHGNVTVVTQVIQVNDDTSPSLSTPPAAITVSQNAIPAAAVLTSSDNCAPVQVTVNPDVTTSLPKPLCWSVYYLINRVWVATDVCGNTSTAVQEITVSDQVLLTCPSNKTINTTNDGVSNYNCSTLVMAANEVNPVWSDVCGLSGVRYSVTGATTTNGFGVVAGVVLNKGLNQVTYTASFNPGLNCTFSINVIDNEAPRFTSSLTSVVDACDFSSLPANPSVTDNCDVPVLTLISDITAAVPGCATKSPTLKYTKSITRTWEARDLAGNVTTTRQIVYLRDMVAPTSRCRNFTVVVGNTNVTVAASAFNSDILSSSDNCGGALTYAVCNGGTSAPGTACTNFAGSAVFSRSMLGTANTVVLYYNVRVTDACGNSSTCFSTVTLKRAGTVDNSTSSNNISAASKATDARPFTSSGIETTHGTMKCFPNPFSEDLNIDYNLTDNVEKVVLKLYDTQGKLIRMLDQGALRQGYYNARWNLADISPGVYNICLEFNGKCQKMQRVVLVK